jgi:hypothetical protein
MRGSTDFGTSSIEQHSFVPRRASRGSSASCATRSTRRSRARAARHLEDEPGVDGAELELVALGHQARASFTWSSSHLSLVPEKYGSSTRPVVCLARAVLHQLRLQAPDAARWCGGPARRWRGARACRRDPQARRLALVGDADGRDVGAASPSPASARARCRARSCPRSPSGRARRGRPSGSAG